VSLGAESIIEPISTPDLWLDDAAWCFDRTEVGEKYGSIVDPGTLSGMGRPKALQLRAFSIVGIASAMHRLNDGHIVTLTATANGLTRAQRRRIGLGFTKKGLAELVWKIEGSYDRFDRTLNRLAYAMEPELADDATPEEAVAWLDAVDEAGDWWLRQFALASIPDGGLTTGALATDDTWIGSYGILHVPNKDKMLGEDGELNLTGQRFVRRYRRALRSGRRKRGPKCQGRPTDEPMPVIDLEDEHLGLVLLGPDGKKIYVPSDPQARASVHTTTNKQTKEEFVGYKFFSAVQARELLSVRNPHHARLGPKPPPYMPVGALRPAGRHSGRSVTPPILATKEALAERNKSLPDDKRNRTIEEVIPDSGFSRNSVPEFFHFPLGAADIAITHRPVTDQNTPRRIAPQRLDIGSADPSDIDPRYFPWIIGGVLFSPLLPAEYLELTPPAWTAPREEKKAYEEKCNERAMWRMPYIGTTASGMLQYMCPVHWGWWAINNPEFEWTFTEHRKNQPKRQGAIWLPEGMDKCCQQATMTFDPADLYLVQRAVPFTTAGRKAYSRRVVVEGKYSRMKTQWMRINSDYFNVRNQTKITILLGFAVAAYNLRIKRREEHKARQSEYAQEQALERAAADHSQKRWRPKKSRIQHLIETITAEREAERLRKASRRTAPGP
jgi:hypothetical protein